MRRRVTRGFDMSRASKVRWRARSPLLVTLLIALGCAGEGVDPGDQRFPVAVSVTTDDGAQMEGATIVIDGRTVGTTPRSGTLDAALIGKDGDRVAIGVSCPSGFATAEESGMLRLTRVHRLGVRDVGAVTFAAVCVRRRREVVVVIHAPNGGALPVGIDGKAAGTTDSNGILHVLAEPDRAVSSINVTLDTGGRPGLRPRNPSRTFDLSGRDAILVFAQRFVPVSPPVSRRGSPPVRHVPYRID